MTALQITQLIISIGPAALQLIQDLTAVWSSPSLTPDQINTILSKAQTSYDAYIAQAKAAAGKT